MKRIYKSMLIPLIRIPQVMLMLAVFVLLLMMVYGLGWYVVWLWKWLWEVGLAVIILTVYGISVLICHETNANW